MKTTSALRLLPLVLLLGACGGGGGGGGSNDGTGDDTATVAARSASLGGSIAIDPVIAVDSDLNDPRTSWVSNDERAAPQPLQDITTVGGYAAAAATASGDDRYASAPDPRDVYRLSLAAGERLTLYVSAHPDADLDLRLLPVGADTAVASSSGGAATESVTAPSAGEYDLVVEAAAGASTYLLIRESAASMSALAEDFVPGEIIVTFKSDAAGELAPRGLLTPSGQELPERAAALGLQVLRGAPGRPALLGLGQGQERERALEKLGIKRARRAVLNILAKDERERLKRETALAVDALRARPDVEHADLNYIRQPLALPNDSYFPQQWHYPLIHVPQAWDAGFDGQGVVVAVIDTGIATGHPDLDANVLPSGYDFVSSSANAGDGDGLDPDPSDVEDSFHGTHVAGTIAAVTGNGRGVAGVAPGARLLPVRVCGIDGCRSYDVMQGIKYAAGLSNDSGKLPPVPAWVINISLGGASFSGTEQRVFDAVRARGIHVVAAAGNGGDSAVQYPAGYRGVLGVGAVDGQRQRATYSSYGAHVALAAPGGAQYKDADGDGYPDAILSTAADLSSGSLRYTYTFYQGTSMAAPHVAGVLALMLSAHPGLTPADVDAALAAGGMTVDLGPEGRDDQYGYGLVDALLAVRAARAIAGGDAQPPRLRVTPAPLAIGPAVDTLEFRVANAGGGRLSIAKVSEDAEWLELQPSSVAGDGTGTYALRVDRSPAGQALAQGKYYANLRVSADIGTLDVPISLEVGPGDAGLLYVLLLDPDTRLPRYVAIATAADGYRFGFGGVSPGRYLIYAGSDPDNDGDVCDTGEACAAYPSLNAPVAVDLQGAQNGLRLEGGFDPLRTAAPLRRRPELP